MTPCPVCDQPMPELNRNGKPRRACSMRCAGSIGSRPTRGVTAEEALWLLEGGASPIEVARRLGLKPASVGRSLARHGHHEQARHFYKLGRLEQRHPCADCPELVNFEATRCQRCSRRALQADPAYRAAWAEGMARRDKSATARFKGQAA